MKNCKGKMKNCKGKRFFVEFFDDNDDFEDFVADELNETFMSYPGDIIEFCLNAKVGDIYKNIKRVK